MANSNQQSKDASKNSSTDNQQQNTQQEQNESPNQPSKGKEHSDTPHPHTEKNPVAKPGKG